MSSHSKFSSLCHLINDSVRPFTEPEVISLTNDKEKDLLIALSGVLREIQLMKLELDCDSDKEAAPDPACDREYSDGSEMHHQELNCLIKILADLIALLTVESQFVQHLVGNILVVISELVAASGSEWDSFIHLLVACLKSAIANMLSLSLASSTSAAGDSSSYSSSFSLLKSRPENSNWSTAAAIIRVLRKTLKYLKQEDDDHLCEMYLDSVSSFLSDVPWDLMHEIQNGQSNDAKESDSQNSHFIDASFVRNDGEETRVVFLGNFIQFLCSLIEQSCAVESKGDSHHEHHPVHCMSISFVPKLLVWCLGEHGNFLKTSVSHYFRHKLLMLMLRLSYQTSLGCSILISWLQFLHGYFKELLWKPITKLDFGQDECLEGSPFLLCLSDGEHRINSYHLQRCTVLLFLKCCFSLISSTRKTSRQCGCATLNCSLTFDSISDLDSYGRRQGFLELYKWVQGHLPIDIFVDHEMNLEKCRCFALSFLQLYMHEDDVLFKVLLELLNIQPCLEQQSSKEKWTYEDVKQDTPFYVASIFNPVNLFHLFLAELHYDHQVLLDYLISKDTGITSAEYLLRCLRTVCNSWNLFITFSMHEKIVDHSSCKKGKMYLNDSNVQVEASSIPVKDISSSLEDKCKRDFGCNHKHYKTTSQLFKKAKNCLLSLKHSVESLHRKNLFPYNPEVLLKRMQENIE
ncbi:uncharacterized protein LOC110630150 isoform X3 [Manihot esculenta]|uniref:uncharacterized protein LOC110630150 isoform X3 n=1 Tax=Manihot esculenta TaxID=3983 RepID=UPI000B5D8CBF|nr:uncharacterized protein LOC110630150 isoform X3 [Manihot esculenta]